MLDTRLPEQRPTGETARPRSLVIGAVFGLMTVALLVFAAFLLYDILDVYGNLEGEPWEFSALMMGVAAFTGTAAVGYLSKRPSAPLLIGSFVIVALIGAAIFGLLVLVM